MLIHMNQLNGRHNTILAKLDHVFVQLMTIIAMENKISEINLREHHLLVNLSVVYIISVVYEK